jgi:16S rRNA (guanine527-N7)-methyltransferase
MRPSHVRSTGDQAAQRREGNRDGPSHAQLDPAHWRSELTELLAQAREHGVECEEAAVESLATYCATLARWASHTNLVSRSDLPRLVSKHVSASMGVLLVAKPGRNEAWIDVGSGAGFPGMVVKLCSPTGSMTLLDSSQKKTAFLEEVRRSLQIADLDVVRARVEEVHDAGGSEAHAGLARQFSVILMRAVAPLADSFELIERVSSTGCRFLTFKGPSWERELAGAGPAMDKRGWVFDGETKIPWALGRILGFTKH